MSPLNRGQPKLITLIPQTPEMNVGYTHASNEIWGLSADAAHYDALASTLALREQLRPYTAALVAEVVAAGTPMLRPLFWEFPWDANVTTGVNAAPGSEFSFMYGAEYLVAPVVVEGANFSSVYLPRPLPGFTWHYLFNATEVAGGQLAVVDVCTYTRVCARQLRLDIF